MAKLKCNDCGHVFNSDELDSYQECVGECHGVPAYETFYVCPHCGSDEYDEVEEDRDGNI